MICLIVLALAVFTAPTPAASVDTCTARSNRTEWNSPPPGFAWVDAFFGSVPKGAVIGGYGPKGREIYVCRTFHAHNLIPGKVNSYMGNCDVAWDGTEHDVPMYQVLVNKNHTTVLSWVDASNGTHPANAVVGGYKCDCDKPEGDLQYVGRTNFDVCPNGICLASSVIFPGKVDQCLNGFHWSYGGKGYYSSTYQIAVWNYPVSTTRKPNTTEPIETTTEVPISTTEFIPSSSTEFTPSSSTEFTPSSSTEFTPSSSTEFTPSSSTQFPPSSSTEFTPSSSTEFTPSSSTEITQSTTTETSKTT